MFLVMIYETWAYRIHKFSDGIQEKFGGLFVASYLIEVFRLNEHRRWELFSFEGAGRIVELTSIGLHCALMDFYEDVIFT